MRVYSKPRPGSAKCTSACWSTGWSHPSRSGSFGKIDDKPPPKRCVEKPKKIPAKAESAARIEST
jgi:hypothetical protein